MRSSGWAAVVITAGTAVAQPVAMDGLLDEWATVPLAATDATGDASGPLDVTGLRVRSAGTTLWLQFDLANVTGLQAGAPGEATLRVRIRTGTREVLIDTRGRAAFIDGSTTATPWATLDFVAQPTVASSRFEMRVDLAAIGATAGAMCQVSLEGADSLANTVMHQLGPAEPAPAPRPLTRPANGALRVVSLNTLVTGLTNPTRRPALLRLIDSVEADVYCFQEEYNSTREQIVTALAQADPRENGLPWNVIKTGELVLASQRTLVAVPFSARYQGAVVRADPSIPGSRDILVINNHMSCCGYPGDPSDAARITQSTDAAAVFMQFRAGTLSGELAPFAQVPAIVVGDWNLVGTSTPTDIWAGAPGLRRQLTPHLTRGDAWTWRSNSGLDFWPGALDIVMVDISRTLVLNAFALDTVRLDAATLSGAGLLATDSSASDHLLIVTDLADSAACDDIDFNNNEVFPEDQDVVDFFDVLAGATCAPCNDIDFNNNDVFPEDQDVIDFFNVLAGGDC